MQRDHIILIPYGDDPLALLAQHILIDFAEQLPDLTPQTIGATVLLAEPQAAKRLRQLLLQQAAALGYKALLCPRIMNLRDLADQQFRTSQKQSQTICNQHQRELILFDVLSQHRTLLGSGSPWNLTDDLLKLFDQLTLNQNKLAQTYADFEKEIAQAYGLSADAFPALGREATLVYTLWQAWHTQLNAQAYLDKEAAYLLGLNHVLNPGLNPELNPKLNPELNPELNPALNANIQHHKTFFYIAGYHQFTLAEQNWLKQLIEQQRIRLYLHGQPCIEESSYSYDYHPDQPISDLLKTFNIKLAIDPVETSAETYSQFINRCYANDQQPFKQRAAEFARHHPEVSKPEDSKEAQIKNRLKLILTKSHEEQAHAVELQIRRWLLAGKSNIGIVTENRRLARRVRALLERADVSLQDLAGWALSTTRAGAILERWLECIEEDFAHLPLLDLLKSPFIFSDLDAHQVKYASYRLEHDIIRRENIARNLQRYRRQIHSRAERLQWSSDISEILLQILDRFEAAAELLRPLLKSKHSAYDYIEKLSSSLEMLGITALLKEDEAGSRIIEMLATLKHSAQHSTLKFSWSDFRTWIGRSLETFVFTAELADSPISLMGLGQSRLQQFDALIIASAENENLPGHTSHTPFFNNAVRRQLKLTTNQQQLSERFHHFRRLLESAPEILITANNEENGEAVPLSPWLEIIHRFYLQAYGTSLEDEELKSLLTQPATQVIRCRDKNLPESTQQPATSVPAALLPKRYSPSSYQQLMDCPYQFFAAQCLALSPSEEVMQALSKSDYGERVHLCLQAFHSDVTSLPGPFTENLAAENRDAAIQALTETSEQVFARDLDANFEHTAWLGQWLKLIPEYIDWQTRHATKWTLYKTEHRSQISGQNNLEYSGRLDRVDESIDESVDKNETGLNIIDYKTGKSASLTAIEQGEAVQLPFYALLAEEEFKKPVSTVSYLNLENKVKLGTQLSGDELETISHKIGDRLAQVVEQMQSGKTLTAWGDETTCQYCTVNRLCRKQAWNN